MKRIIALVILLALLPILAFAQTESWGPSVIAGAGFGYGYSGPERQQTFVFQYAALKLKALSHGAIYAGYQHGAVQGSGVGGDGAKLLLADQWTWCPSFTWVFGLGFLDNLQPLLDQTPMKVGLTFDVGLSYDASEWFDLGLYSAAWDRGGRADFNISLIGTIKDPWALIPGLGKGK